MPNTNKTLIAVVLDRSGSMQALRESTVAGLNTFLEGQKALPGDVTLHFVQFDDQYEYAKYFTNLRDTKPLTQADFEPRGSTALLDAIGRTITEVGAKLAATPEADRPGKVVFVVQTDGFENASREFNHARIQDMIKHQREKYSWEFVFLAAGQDAIVSGGALGFLPNQALTYNANAVSTRKGFSAVSRAIGSYRSNMSANAVYSAQDKADVVDDSKTDLTDSEALDKLLTIVPDVKTP